MTGVRIIFDPSFSWPVLYAAALCAVLLLGFAAWRGLAGWALRGAGIVVLLGALAGPSLQTETREPLRDILVVLVDETASQRVSDRAAQTGQALARMRAQVAQIAGLDLHVVQVEDSEDNRGSRVLSALSQTLAQLARDRVAGVVLISDGQVHDVDAAPEMPAPLHLLLTGHAPDWDRRLIVKNAPAFAILGEEQKVVLHIEDQGAAPQTNARTTLGITIDGGEPQFHDVPVGVDLEMPIVLDHGGANVIHFTLPEAEGELTTRNNAAVVQISGVRDRLRVLLVSGEPHPGTRTWRNLLKSDSAVDLVHFTILRPPEKQDGVPVSELSLIAFPTNELFMEKIDEFDLIIFDRYKLRGLLPAAYLQSVKDYVGRGGAVLVAAGPDFASVNSLARSPLGDILPAQPTARLIEEGFSPALTDLGQRHPVTRGLQAFAPGQGWGQWFRLVELAQVSGQVVMSGANGAPLLVLNRVGEGRVALLASDHAWLWSRGFQGGGPQLELLRRLAHWMMKEPELEEESLSASAEGRRMTITRSTLGTGPRSVTITPPDGVALSVPLNEVAPGVYQAQYTAPVMGLFRLEEGGVTAVAALGPAAPREFEETVASSRPLEALIARTHGGARLIEAASPGLRAVREGRPAAGRGWIGYTPRNAYISKDIRIVPLLPRWAFLLLAAGFAVAAWFWEGRGRRT